MGMIHIWILMNPIVKQNTSDCNHNGTAEKAALSVARTVREKFEGYGIRISRKNSLDWWSCLVVIFNTRIYLIIQRDITRVYMVQFYIKTIKIIQTDYLRSSIGMRIFPCLTSISCSRPLARSYLCSASLLKIVRLFQREVSHLVV